MTYRKYNSHIKSGPVTGADLLQDVHDACINWIEEDKIPEDWTKEMVEAWIFGIEKLHPEYVFNESVVFGPDIKFIDKK